MSSIRHRSWILLAGLLLPLGACAPAPLLDEVSIEPAAITPDMDGHQDVARIRYRIGAPALLDIELVGSDGSVHPFREARRRSAGAYEALFGGVLDGRMLADDRYTVRLRALPRGEDGQPLPGAEAVVVEQSLQLTGGDKEPPRIEGLAVQPRRFSPNQDGLGDRVAISYRLDEPAEVRLWLAEPDGDYVTDILETVDSARHAGEPGPHQYDFDAGVDADAPPPPDGDYLVVAEARDATGNVTREEVPLSIRDGGQPRVGMSGDVAWSETVLELGQTLWFTVTVENIGATPLRSFGPEPGFVYDNRESFNQPAPRGWLLLARRGRPGEAGYRAASARLFASAASPAPGGSYWLLGAPELELVEPPVHATSRGAEPGTTPGVGLAPDRAAGSDPLVADTSAASAATGASEPTTTDAEAPPDGPTPASAAAAPSLFEAGALADPSRGPDQICGLLLEDGRPAAGAEVFLFFMDGDRGRSTRSDDAGRYCFDSLPTGDDLDRSYARSPGAIRLGAEYDEKRTDLGYPFRWQLGPTALMDVCDADDRLYLCLPPGARREVWGGIRFSEPPFRRQTAIYLALEHEDVRRIQGPYDPTRLTVESP